MKMFFKSLYVVTILCMVCNGSLCWAQSTEENIILRCDTSASARFIQEALTRKYVNQIRALGQNFSPRSAKVKVKLVPISKVVTRQVPVTLDQALGPIAGSVTTSLSEFGELRLGLSGGNIDSLRQFTLMDSDPFASSGAGCSRYFRVRVQASVKEIIADSFVPHFGNLELSGFQDNSRLRIAGVWVP